MRRGASMRRSRPLRRAETPRRGGSSGASRTRCSGSASRWLSDAGVRVSRPDRRDSGARVQGAPVGLVVALMQTELRCPLCGDDLGLEDDLFDDGAPIRLRCSGCGRWLMVECYRRLNVVDLGDYAEMRKGLRTR